MTAPLNQSHVASNLLRVVQMNLVSRPKRIKPVSNFNFRRARVYEHLNSFSFVFFCVSVFSLLFLFHRISAQDDVTSAPDVHGKRKTFLLDLYSLSLPVITCSRPDSSPITHLRGISDDVFDVYGIDRSSEF